MSEICGATGTKVVMQMEPWATASTMTSHAVDVVCDLEPHSDTYSHYDSTYMLEFGTDG